MGARDLSGTSRWISRFALPYHLDGLNWLSKCMDLTALMCPWLWSNICATCKLQTQDL